MTATPREIRTRYAPSPTGDPHVGNIRTAIWAWLLARHAGGKFLIRLEDTDQSRSVPDSLERILASLEWLGVDWDEGPDIGGLYGPYIQSERLPRYAEATARLIAQGDAYPCFCTSQELETLRQAQQAAKLPPGYDGRCHAIDPAEAAARAAREAHVVRFHMPDDGVTTFKDLLRGDISVENRLLDDFVILKSDGFPTYHLAHVVDDEAMQITHVVRGEEWLPSAPRHVQVVDALGYERPVYVHNSVILGPDGGKLSKRHGARFILEYAQDGYLPEAIFNYLAILGWSLDDHTEIMTRERFIEVFDIRRLSVTPAVFDNQKLDWFNGTYLRDDALTSPAQLLEHFRDHLDRELPITIPRPLDRGVIEALVPLVRERIKTLAELPAMVGFFFSGTIEAPSREALLGKPYRADPDAARRALDGVTSFLEGAPAWDAPAIEARLRAAVEELAQKPGDVFMLCRLAVTGRAITPPLFESMAIISRELCVERLRSARVLLDG
ncbi:MAG: glutamate--tRNA ligase [Dehalococcoidia bacterium]|nr:glutamate--tRNA ligase [Dehalococcoidia bacterium]